MIWLRQLVAGLSPQKSRFGPDQSVRDLWWTKYKGTRLSPSNLVFPSHYLYEYSILIHAFITGTIPPDLSNQERR